MNGRGTSGAPLVGNLLGLLAGLALLVAILAMAFLAGLGEEGAVLGTAVMLVPLFSVALGAALARDERSLLGRQGLALPVALGMPVAIVAMLAGGILLRNLFSDNALWAPDSLLEGILIVGSCLVGAQAGGWLYGKRRSGASAR